MSNIQRYLDNLMTNGRAEVGLEVGADPGLSVSEYIRIPKSMIRKMSGKIIVPASPSGATVKGEPGTHAWTPGEIYVINKKIYRVRSDGTMGEELSSISVDKPQDWEKDIRAFVAANEAHIMSAELNADLTSRVHAIRYWAVVAGLVVTSKTGEYVEVDTPSKEACDNVDAETVSFISSYHGQAWTACIARTTSWRKSNHATGGQGGTGGGIASGFPRRWLSREGLWNGDSDKKKSDPANRQATTAFYIATHAVSVHAVLALSVGEDGHHWVKLDPKYGFLPPDVWDLRDSAKQRIAPRTQVAGASMVTDAVVVMKMLINEGIAGLLVERGLARALASAYKRVEEEGMRLATYSGWFFDGHPLGVSKTSFSQKDTAYAALVGELGAAAVNYYRGSTISDSPSLSSASSQLASPSAREMWAQLGRVKTSAVSPVLVAAYGRITGAASAMAVDNLTSGDPAKVKEGVDGYNKDIESLAKDYGVATFTKVTIEAVNASAAAADARAQALASAGAA